jgi:predicted dehydrogenase
MKDGKVNVAIVGMGFGAEFIPIYQRHPHTNMYAICQRDVAHLNQVGDAFGVAKRYTSFEELLANPEVEAVHINSPIDLHGPMSIAALKAGKHVASTVPMSRSIDECREIVELQLATGKKYMMMETAVYTREFLYVKELLAKGDLGRLQFVRAAHHQEMAAGNWPAYWPGMPPMHYATHCVGPCLALVGKRAEWVSCLGSGRVDEKYERHYGSPFAIETTHIKLKDSEVNAEITRSLYNTSREYVESFDAYGSVSTFEWQQLDKENPVVFCGEDGKRVPVPDYAHLLPEPIRPFTTQGVYDTGDHAHMSFIQGAGHGGSHPHLVHEFVMSIVEDREPFPNAAQSANWTCTGICAHESALQGGKIIGLPEFTLA